MTFHQRRALKKIRSILEASASQTSTHGTDRLRWLRWWCGSGGQGLFGLPSGSQRRWVPEPQGHQAQLPMKSMPTTAQAPSNVRFHRRKRANTATLASGLDDQDTPAIASLPNATPEFIWLSGNQDYSTNCRACWNCARRCGSGYSRSHGTGRSRRAWSGGLWAARTADFSPPSRGGRRG